LLDSIKYFIKGYTPWTPARYKPYAYGQKYSDPFYTHINFVYIIYDDIKARGSFYCTLNWCEIRTPKVNMIVPRCNVEFYKKIEKDFPNKVIKNNYIALIKKYSTEDIDRWKRWKRKNKKRKFK